MPDALVSTTPMSAGDLVGRAVRYYRVNLPMFVKVLMWPTLTSIAAKVAMQWGTTVVWNKEWGLIGPAVAATLIGFIVLLVATFILTMRNLALVRLASGFADNFQSAYEFVRSRAGLLFGLIFVGHLMLFGVMMLWCGEIIVSSVMFKPGSALVYAVAVALVIGFVGLIATFAIFMMVGFLTMSIASCENRSFGALLSRGFALTFNDFGRAVLFGILLLATVSLLSWALSIPAVALSFFEVFRHGLASASGDPAKMPMYVLVFSQAWESVVNMLLWPITWLAYGYFYYDLRVRQEGIDVVNGLKLLERAGAS